MREVGSRTELGPKFSSREPQQTTNNRLIPESDDNTMIRHRSIRTSSYNRRTDETNKRGVSVAIVSALLITAAIWYYSSTEGDSIDKSSEFLKSENNDYGRRRKRADLSTLISLVYEPDEEGEEEDVGGTLLHSPPRSDKMSSKAFLATIPRGGKRQHHRIAIIIPYVASTDVAPTLPSYFTAFATAAGGSAALVDFLILYDGNIPPYLLPPSLPSNVKLLSVGSSMAELFLRCLDQEKDVSQRTKTSLIKIIGNLLHNYPYLLVEYKPALGHIFQEYIDTNYYTHWGYSDLDILFGDLPRWITAEELEEFDIVTYGFGDQGRFYLRGQFTIHKNQPDTINQLWRGCKYLSQMHHRFLQVSKGKASLRLESAEGCYSAAILQREDIKVKYAVKAFTDVNTLDYITDASLLGDRTYKNGLYHGIGSDGSMSVLYKAGPKSSSYSPDLEDTASATSATSTAGKGPSEMIVSLPLNWFEAHPMYSDPTIQLQREVGERIPIQTMFQKNNGVEEGAEFNCMYWAPKKYQKYICAPIDDVQSTHTVFWINGQMYKQRHETVSFYNNTIITYPIFHFQEWKRTYRSSPLYPMKFPSTALGWVLFQEGAIPVYPPVLSADENDLLKKSAAVARAGSTQYHGHGGVVQTHIINNWIQAEDIDRMFLPSSNHVYCLKSSQKQFPALPHVAQCDEALSWQDSHRVILLNNAPSWDTTSYGEDITLLLTLQLHWNPTKPHYQQLLGMLDLAEKNILSWDNSVSGRKQPCILIIHVAGATEDAVELLQDRFGVALEISIDGVQKKRNQPNKKQQQNRYPFCLVAAMFCTNTDGVSQKALWNMAADAAPTRWIVTGLQIERGLVISKEASRFAQRATHVQGDVPGKLFLIPQFTAHSNIISSTHQQQHGINVDSIHSASHALSYVGLGELLQAKDHINLSWDISSLDCVPCDVDEESKKAEENVLHKIETLWWELTMARLTHTLGRNNGELLEGTAWIKAADDIEYALIEYLLPDNQHKLETFGVTPLVMMDRIGPRKRMLTLNVARGVEELGGSQCFNGLMVSQLSTLGYDIRVLPGAFALSLPAWRDQISLGGNCKEQRRKLEDNGVVCEGCSMITDSIKNSIAKEERERVAKAALLWREMDSHKIISKDP